MGLKLQILSDLHLIQWENSEGRNYWSDEFPKLSQTDADVLVLAGDIVSMAPRHIKWSRTRLTEFGTRYRHVVMVAGNHEHYSTSINKGLAELYAMEEQVPGLTVLRPGRVSVIEGQRFLGGAMFQPTPPPDHIANFAKISDHYTITNFDSEAPEQFRLMKEFLEAELRAGDVVVSHHAPSEKSIDAQWAGNPSNWWFITPQIEPLILERKPVLAVHGHTHSPFDYILGSTRVVCEPKGYPGERSNFNFKKTVEIP